MTEARRDIGQFIREQRNLAELSVRRLADMAGVSNPYLSQIERGLRKPSAEILLQLAQALQVSAETMYVQAGMLDADAGAPPASLEVAIRNAAELTEDQRKALLGVYRSFVGFSDDAAEPTAAEPTPAGPTGTDSPGPAKPAAAQKTTAQPNGGADAASVGDDGGSGFGGRRFGVGVDVYDHGR